MIDKLILRLFERLMWSGTTFFFGIGMGPSKEEKQQEGLLSGIGGFGSSHGQKDVMSSENFWSAILSGDMGQIAKVLSPQISTINKQTQERKKTMSEFGNRGGGTNAASQALDDSSIAGIRSMISNLTGEAASNLGSMGMNLLNTGISGGTAAFDASKVIHDQNEAKWNDIFKSIEAVVAAIPGGPGSFGDVASNAIGGATA